MEKPSKERRSGTHILLIGDTFFLLLFFKEEFNRSRLFSIEYSIETLRVSLFRMFTTLKPGEVVELQYLVYSLHSSLLYHTLSDTETHT